MPSTILKDVVTSRWHPPFTKGKLEALPTIREHVLATYYNALGITRIFFYKGVSFLGLFVWHNAGIGILRIHGNHAQFEAALKKEGCLVGIGKTITLFFFFL